MSGPEIVKMGVYLEEAADVGSGKAEGQDEVRALCTEKLAAMTCLASQKNATNASLKPPTQIKVAARRRRRSNPARGVDSLNFSGSAKPIAYVL